MSPEQFTGVTTVDWRVDLWSLAVVAYRCLTGVFPFNGHAIGSVIYAVIQRSYVPAGQLQPSLPSAVDAWFAKAFHGDIETRYQSARELAAALAKCTNAATAPAGGHASLPYQTAQELAAALAKHGDAAKAPAPRRASLPALTQATGTVSVAPGPQTSGLPSLWTGGHSGVFGSEDASGAIPLCRTQWTGGHSDVMSAARPSTGTIAGLAFGAPKSASVPTSAGRAAGRKVFVRRAMAATLGLLVVGGLGTFMALGAGGNGGVGGPVQAAANVVAAPALIAAAHLEITAETAATAAANGSAALTADEAKDSDVAAATPEPAATPPPTTNAAAAVSSRRDMAASKKPVSRRPRHAHKPEENPYGDPISRSQHSSSSPPRPAAPPPRKAAAVGAGKSEDPSRDTVASTPRPKHGRGF